jgi:hypothetical protein
METSTNEGHTYYKGHGVKAKYQNGSYTLSTEIRLTGKSDIYH